MRHIFTLLATASISLLCLAAPAGAAEHPGPALAPADEYFGRYHMSILAIRNAIHDFNSKISSDPGCAASYIGGVALTEDAVRAWGAKYPHDPMLATASLGIERLYLKIGGNDGMDRANDLVTWLDTVLPHDTTTNMAHVLIAEQTAPKPVDVSSVAPPAAIQAAVLKDGVNNAIPPSADDRSEADADDRAGQAENAFAPDNIRKDTDRVRER